MKQYADYMMVLSPSAEVTAMVDRHKRNAARVIGQYESMHSVAHISLKTIIRQKVFAAEPVIMAMGKGLRTLPPLMLTIDGFDYFNHGEDYKTIYAKLRTDHVASLWFKTLKKHLGVKEFMVPHITIARNIPIWAFNQLWPHFKNIKWIEQFTVTGLTILQRETFATFAPWQQYITLPFEARHLATPVPHKPQPVKPAHKNGTPSGQTSLF